MNFTGNKRGFFRWSLLLALSLLAFGCGDEHGRYDVDPDSLGVAETSDVLGLTFRAPKEFQLAPPEYVAAAKRALAATPSASEEYFIVPEMIYAIPESSARCFVSGFPNAKGGAFDAEWRKGYLVAAEEKAPNGTIRNWLYDLGEVQVFEIQIQDQLTINRRLVCKGVGAALVQIDYTVPRSEYGSLKSAIESSFGSIQFF